MIGSGSLCFEMIRALAQRLPVMICPRWVGVKAQPIAVEDVVAYLLQALELPVGDAAVFEIGGADQVSYGEIMQEYARQCGLRRWMIPVPVLTPRLSSLWLGLVTPIYARIGRKLVDSMRNPTLVRNPSALKVFDIRPKGTLIVIAGNPKTVRRMTFLIASLCILIFIILTILLLRDDRAPWTPSTLHPSMFLQSSAIN